MVKNAILARHSVRGYLSRPVSSEQIHRILRAGMQAPSALDGRSWEFIVVCERNRLELLAGMSRHAELVRKAPAAFIICNDLNRAEASGEKDWWVQGLSACTENILLQIVDEGLGGVWLGCYPRQDRIDYVRKHFLLPNHIIPFAVVAFGYSAEDSCAEDRYDSQKVHYERYGQRAEEECETHRPNDNK